ncbi:MAG: glycosyltransferase [Alistipes sp.]|nr:glycosyltransferase [Alistipes sp.]
MISVCIATYNGGKYIRPQLDSILSQLGEKDEVIISDSRSTDDTLDIVRSYHDPRIRIFDFDNSGIGSGEEAVIMKVKASFLFAISKARGNIVFLSDQDDIWYENKVDECRRALAAADLVAHSYVAVDNDMNVITQRQLDENPVFLKTLFQNPFQGSCMAFGKKVRDQIVRHSQLLGSARLSHDHVIGYLCWALDGKRRIVVKNTPLIRYRRHADNVSTTTGKSKYSLKFKILYRIREILLFIRLKCKKNK